MGTIILTWQDQVEVGFYLFSKCKLKGMFGCFDISTTKYNNSQEFVSLPL
jgi:hypothetical protein